MSLIHEALRKARHEASHHDDPGVVFPGGLTGRGRQRGLGAGLVLGVVLTFAVGAIIGGVLWWMFRQTPAASGGFAEASEESAAPTPISETAVQASSTPVDEEGQTTDSPGATEATVERDSPLDPDIGSAHTDQLQHAETTDPGTVAEEPSDAPPASSKAASGNREYLVEADLGYATLSLDYIMVSPSGSFAQINGLDIKVGGEVEGFTLEEITEDWVRLRDDRGPLVLRVPRAQ